MAVFINGIGSISGQLFDTRHSLQEFESHDTNRITCKEPDYKDLVPPMQLRRMSRVVRMGVASAKAALKDAGIEKPTIITMGTSYGCLADTEVFLSKLLTQDETMLTPTSFIQSTHNTVSGQIALMIGCHGHNFTYVHRGHSFETSLQESIMWLNEQEDINVLIGGVDEMTMHSFEIMSRFGTFKKEHDAFDIPSEGTIAGEGANMFVVSNQQNDHTYAEVLDVCMCMTEDVSTQLDHILSKNNLNASDINVCFVGVNGDNRYDEEIFNNVSSLSNATFAGFKKWCGEYPTSGAFALTLASTMLYTNHLPEQFILSNSKQPTDFNYVLIYNHYKNQYHSFTLLKKLSN